MYYGFILASAFVAPFCLSFYPRFRFRMPMQQLFVCISASAVLFIIWDVLFTRLGVWGFNSAYHLGFVFLGLPIEEVLFFVLVPFCCLFTYNIVRQFTLGHTLALRMFSLVLGVSFLLVSVSDPTRYYTAVVCFFAALACAYALWKTPAFLTPFFFSYLVLLFPFLLVNGALTGSFSQSEVVWYNPDHISGLRVLTIPAEDFVYSGLLTFLNVAVFEWLEKRSAVFPRMAGQMG